MALRGQREMAWVPPDLCGVFLQLWPPIAHVADHRMLVGFPRSQVLPGLHPTRYVRRQSRKTRLSRFHHRIQDWGQRAKEEETTPESQAQIGVQEECGRSH